MVGDGEVEGRFGDSLGEGSRQCPWEWDDHVKPRIWLQLQRAAPSCKLGFLSGHSQPSGPKVTDRLSTEAIPRCICPSLFPQSRSTLDRGCLADFSRSGWGHVASGLGASGGATVGASLGA